MGKPAQRRLIRKLNLELFLSQVKPNLAPDAKLEQYTLSESAAATMLYLAAYQFGAIVGKRIVDLGCGTGRLALGAAFMGAESVVGVDIDKNAVKVAFENSVNVGFKDSSAESAVRRPEAKRRSSLYRKSPRACGHSLFASQPSCFRYAANRQTEREPRTTSSS